MSWGLASMVLLVVALALQIAAFERGKLSARSLGLVAAMAALAVAGRLAFAPLPNVKPTTDIVLIAGFALGASPGFAVGAITALVSNMVFGQGPWTPWQMLAWGLVGVLGALFARATGGRVSRWGLAAVGAFAGLFYGVILDVSQWLLYGGTPKESTLIAYSIASLPWNLAHAAGNVVFALAFGPALIEATRRASRRLEPVWMPRGVPLNSLALPALAAVAALVPLGAHLASSNHGSIASPRSTQAWLLTGQNRDGGFAVAPGPRASSSPRETAWAALALAASGMNLAGVADARGRSVMDRLAVDTRSLRSATADSPEERAGWEERLLLAAAAGGANPRRFGGRDLVADVTRRVRRSGAVDYYPGDPSVNLTAFAILALRGGGVPARDPVVRRAVRWLALQQQRDGGFAISPRGSSSLASDPDTTGAALQALSAAGHPADRHVRAAIAFLGRSGSRGGGFAARAGDRPNAQSTAMAVLGLRAYPRVASAAAVGGLAYLRSLTRSSGRVDYQRSAGGSSTQTPVWVSAQALLAESGHTLPIFARWSQRRRGVPAPSGARSTGPASQLKSAGQTGRAQPPSPAAETVQQREKVVSIQAALFAGRVAGSLVRAFSGANR